MDTKGMTEDQQQALNERAAIMQYDGGLTQKEAENLAEMYLEREDNGVQRIHNHR